jgi:hypothetical protein
MRKHDRNRCVLMVALLVTVPSIAYGEPITLTGGGFFIDHTEAGNPLDMVASGPGVTLRLFGVWTEHVRPSLGDGFVDTSFAGVFAFDDLEEVAELQLGDRILNFSGTINVSVTGARIPAPPPADDSGSGFIIFPGSFRGSLTGLAEEGEFTLDLTGRGGGFLNFGFPSTPGPLRMRDTSFGFGPSAPIPEPGTLLLLSAGALAGLAKRRRRPVDF